MRDTPTQARLRAGDADRDAVVERLATAMSEGRLQPDEYQQRMEQAYRAKTYADLNRLVADLPSPTPPARVIQRQSQRRGCCW